MSITKVLFSFSGRISRQTYWLACLGLFAFLFLAGVMAGFINALSDGAHKSSGAASAVILLPVYVLVLWSSLAVTTKRWHDRGKSGFWTLIYLVPIIGPLWLLLELGFLAGTPGPNEYDESFFAKDVLLDEEDPLHSMPPIAGRLCVHCQQTIVSFLGGQPCAACHEPLHHECRRNDLAVAHREPARAAYP